MNCKMQNMFRIFRIGGKWSVVSGFNNPLSPKKKANFHRINMIVQLPNQAKLN